MPEGGVAVARPATAAAAATTAATAIFAPWLLYEARPPPRLVAATAITPLQLAGWVCATSALLLPAATTTTVPRATTSSTALWNAAEQAPLEPRLRLMTRAGFAL